MMLLISLLTYSAGAAFTLLHYIDDDDANIFIGMESQKNDAPPEFLRAFSLIGLAILWPIFAIELLATKD